MKLTDNNYFLVEGAGWFDVKGFAIRIHATDEGVVVDVYAKTDVDADAHAEPIASTYAFDTETEQEGADEA